MSTPLSTTQGTATGTSSQYEYDYIVIGGGSGGVSSAKRAAQLHKKRVAIIEGHRWGGTCVNVGCVPKKIMYQTSNVYRTVLDDMKPYEITLEAETTTTTTTEGGTGGGAAAVTTTVTTTPKFHWKALKEKRDAYITRLNNIYLNGLKNVGVTVLEGWGTFVDQHTIEVVSSKSNNDDGTNTKKTIITGDKILIAVGGKPDLPQNITGATEHAITSDGFFELTTQPKKAVIVGGGYIAVELAGVLASLGTDTHLVLRKDMALRTFDPEIATFLDTIMSNPNEMKHLTIHRNTNGISKIEPMPGDGTDNSNNKKRVTTVSGNITIDNADIVLLATGRVPNLHGLQLDKANNIVTDPNKNNTIIVDEYQATSTSNVMAIGDVCGQVELTPMAIAAGRRVADRLFGPSEVYSKAKVSYENVPTVVFSHPSPIGTIGLTEPQAVERYGSDNITVYRSTFVNLHYSMYSHMAPKDKPKTFMKMICYSDTEQVIGIHMIGLNVDEIIQGFGVGMKMGMTKADVDNVIAIHPTSSEEMVTMGTWGTSAQVSGAKQSSLFGLSSLPPPPQQQQQQQSSSLFSSNL